MSLDLTLTFDGHRVRMVGTAERPEWVARDVCRVLCLHVASGVRTVPDDEKGLHIVQTPGGPQETATVTEAGLFRLISRSRKPAAARFQSWLFGEVLPSIRKHGQYPPPVVLRPATREFQIATALLLAQEIITEQGARLAVAEPKAAVLDAIAESDGDLPLQDVGRHLGLGPNRAIWRMEADGLLFRGSHGTLTPHAAWIDAGYFRFVVTHPDDTGRTFGQTKVTKRGLVWLAGRYRADGQLLLPGPIRVDQ
jgi:prophage antirepressor-like protein